MIIRLKHATRLLQPFGLKLDLVKAEDESVDDELQLRTATNGTTGIAIQLSGHYFTACEWLEAEQSMWFGRAHTSLEAATRDALARYQARAHP